MDFNTSSTKIVLVGGPNDTLWIILEGCDPAEPYFQNMPPSVRLDPTDADFVDVIHSDATDIMFIGFGMSHKVGHVDFYPNNGRKQPGCKADKLKSFILEGLNEGGRRFVSCNHQRSLDFMHHSINYRKVTPVGIECPEWKDFLDGKCSECGADTKRCAVMGIRAIEYYEFRNTSVQHAMYLKTSGKPPFWLYHHQVAIKLFKQRVSHKDVKGTIDVTLFGSKADELAHVQANPRNMTNRVFCANRNKGITPKTTANFNRDNSCTKFL